MTFTRSRPLFTAAAMCIGGTLFIGLGGFPLLARAGESSLEFVGNLISNVHHISLDRLDPTYPHCF